MDADMNVETPSAELQGRYINAPVWPWAAAGWALGTLMVLLFLIAWIAGRSS